MRPSWHEHNLLVPINLTRNQCMLCIIEVNGKRILLYCAVGIFDALATHFPEERKGCGFFQIKVKNET